MKLTGLELENYRYFPRPALDLPPQHTVLKDIRQLAAIDPSHKTQWLQRLESELQATAPLPFATAIRHALVG